LGQTCRKTSIGSHSIEDCSSVGIGILLHCWRWHCSVPVAPAQHATLLECLAGLQAIWPSYTFINILQDAPVCAFACSLTGLLCLATCWLPWPFNNADLLIEATGLDLLKEEQRCIFISFQTPKPDSMPVGFCIRLPVWRAWGFRSLRGRPWLIPYTYKAVSLTTVFLLWHELLSRVKAVCLGLGLLVS